MVYLSKDATSYAVYQKQAWCFYRSIRFYLTMALLGVLIPFGDSTLSRIVLPSFWLAIFLFYIFRWLELNKLISIPNAVTANMSQNGRSRTRVLRKVILILVTFWVPVLTIYLTISIRFNNFYFALLLPFLGIITFIPFWLIEDPLSPYASVRKKTPTIWILRVAAILVIVFALGALLTIGFFLSTRR